jgi:AcrR family transcriptional regulator
VNAVLDVYEAIAREAADPPAPDGPGRWPDVREAALTLFSRLGYHGTTMKHVANELGVRAPSLYNHIGSKQEILQRIMVIGMQRLLAYQDAALASTDDVGEQLRRMTGAHVLVHIRHRRSAMVGDRELANVEEPVLSEVRGMREQYESRYREVIERGIREGRFDVGSTKLASFAIIEMASSVSVWFREDGPLSDNQVADEYGSMALRIVGDRPARRTTRKAPAKATNGKASAAKPSAAKAGAAAG